MKKFLKWGTTFILLGVLAVGCIKNDPSEGIEAMRLQQAEYIKANAALVAAKVQVEAANAALIQAQATLKNAEASRILALAEYEKANAAYRNAEVERYKAQTDYLKAYWAAQMEKEAANVLAYQAQMQYWVEQYKLAIARLQDDMVRANQAYEQAMKDYNEWLANNLLAEQDNAAMLLSQNARRISNIMIRIAAVQEDLQIAKAGYEHYTTVNYAKTEEIVLNFKQEKRRLELQIEYWEKVVAAYTEMFNTQVADYVALIEEWGKEIIRLKNESYDADQKALALQPELRELEGQLNDAWKVLNAPEYSYEFQAWEDNSDDWRLGIFGGWYGQYEMTAKGLLNQLKADLATAKAMHKEFEGQGAADTEAEKARMAKVANDNKAAYQNNWNNWQKYYGIVNDYQNDANYQAWQEAYTEWVNKTSERVANENDYNGYIDANEKDADKLMGSRAYVETMVNKYMDALDKNFTNVGDYDSEWTTVSNILGGITFNPGGVLSYLSDRNSILYTALKTLVGGFGVAEIVDGYVANIKAVMDGTHTSFQMIPFWEKVQAYDFAKNAPVPVKNQVMYDIYGDKIVDLTKTDYHIWLFLYWIFENHTATFGAESVLGNYAIFKINPNHYDDGAVQFCKDFFSTVKTSEYELAMPNYNGAPQNAFLKNMVELTKVERAMFYPFNRAWEFKVTFDGGKNYSYIKGSEAAWAWNKDNSSTIKDANPQYKNPSFIAGKRSTPSKYSLADCPVVLDKWTRDEMNGDFVKVGARVPEDADCFFFPLEKYTDKKYYPADDMSQFYINQKSVKYIVAPEETVTVNCPLFLHYVALMNDGDYCTPNYDLPEDLLLWHAASTMDNGTLTQEFKGHIFAYITSQIENANYIAYYNHWAQGIYTSVVIPELEKAIVEVKATYDALYAAYKAILDKYNEVDNTIAENLWIVDRNDAQIDFYTNLIKRAEDDQLYSGRDGYDGIEQLGEDLNAAEAELAHMKTLLAANNANIASWEAGLGLYEGRIKDLDQEFINWANNFIVDRTAEYVAAIESAMVRLQNLYDVLAIYQAQRDALVEKYVPADYRNKVE